MLEPYSIRILPDASEDLVRIVEFIHADIPKKAIDPDIPEKLYAAIDSLAAMPYRHRVHKSAKHPGKVVRALTFPPFVIYYRILESEHWLVILTIRHGASRQPRRFKN